ncbi:MAG: DegT/DnrJ/EryC1/StrS family aminotransferase [Coraliomargaritaceae bacterium]
MSRIYLSPPEVRAEDHAAIEAVLSSNWVAPAGPHLAEFEEAVKSRAGGVSHALAVNSGTSALHLALLALGIGPGDVVACPTLTFAASANPVCYCGAEPIFIDSELRTWNMDPELLADALRTEKNIKAVIIVHLYGQCAEVRAIRQLCDQHGVPLIEDAAEALGASRHGQAAGSFGDLSFFSFNGNKIITTSGGGMLLSENQDWIHHARYLSTQAREPLRHYEHREIGYNYRMSNVLAALGTSQLSGLEGRIERRKKHFIAYSEAFANLERVSMMPIDPVGKPNYWLSCLLVDDRREAIIEALEDESIEARPVWKPLHLQPVFASCRLYGGKIAEQLFNEGLCLPSGSGLTREERNRVIEIVRTQIA